MCQSSPFPFNRKKAKKIDANVIIEVPGDHTIDALRNMIISNFKQAGTVILKMGSFDVEVRQAESRKPELENLVSIYYFT